MKINELPQRYQDQVNRTMQREQQKAAARLHVPGAVANLESHTGNAPLRQKKTARFNGSVGINIIEYRHRRTDFGGGSDKYLIDAIVSAKILPDDDPEIVKWVKKEQFKIPTDEQERTVVEIWSQ